MDSFFVRLLRFLQGASSLLPRIRHSYTNNPRVYQVAFFAFVLVLGVWFSLLGLEWYLRSTKIPLLSLRKIFTAKMNNELGKAVDIGVLDFSLREGIILEDLVISQEEDFAFNQNLLQVKKVTLRLSSYWKENPVVERIDFYSPHISLEADSDIQSLLLVYLRQAKVKEIYFHNLTATIRQKENTIVDWKDGWDVQIKRRNKTLYFEWSNGWFWIPNTTRISGSGFYSEQEALDFSFSFRWKNLPSEEAPLLTSYLVGTTVSQAVSSGSAVVRKNPNQGFLWEGQADIDSAYIPIPFFSGLILDSFFVSETFQFTENQENRKFSGPDFWIDYNTKTIEDKERLLHRNIQFEIEDLSSITEHIRTVTGEVAFPLLGELKGKFSLNESGNKNLWFQLLGELSGKSLVWKTDLFTFEDGTLDLQITPTNQWSGKLRGLSFSKPVSFVGNGTLDWTRQKKTDGTFYYPLVSKSKLAFEAEKWVVTDWVPLFNAWKSETLSEIKERQEKLIPEEYFYQKKVYKYFLESMNFELSLFAKEFYPHATANSLGSTKGNFLVRDGRMALSLPLGETGSKLSSVSYFASKTPNFSLQVELKEYPWSGPWIAFCGGELYPQTVTMDFSYNSIGSDYYSFHKDARKSTYLRLDGVTGKNMDLVSNLPITKNFDKQIFSVEFNLDHYFETNYLRNLVIAGNGIDLKGYGSDKTGDYALSLYGLIGEWRGSFTLAEEETRCTIK